jgi:hypothetical protein
VEEKPFTSSLISDQKPAVDRGVGGATPPPLTPPPSFKDDITVILLLGVSFMPVFLVG